MKSFKHRVRRRINMRSRSGIIVLVLVLIGFLLTPAESSGQAAPPRSQTLQLIQPITPPPVTPVERQIENSRKEVKKKIEVLTLKEQASVGKLPDKYDTSWPKKLPQLSRDAEIRSLETKIQKLQDQINSLTRRLDGLRTQGRNPPK